MNKNLSQVLAVLGFLALWQLLSFSGLVDEAKIPGPIAVAARLSSIAADGSLWSSLKVSVGRVALGYLLACVIGIVFGVVLFQYEILARSFGALVPGFLSLPAAAWLPIALIWYAAEPEKAIQLMILFGAVFSITHATEQGMRQVNPTWVRAARTMGSSGWHLSQTVLLPAALPSIVTGLKQGWAFAWRALMTAELVTEGLGFGNLLKAGQKNRDMPMLLAMIFVIMGIGFLVDMLVFSPLERKLRRQYGFER